MNSAIPAALGLGVALFAASAGAQEPPARPLTSSSARDGIRVVSGTDGFILPAWVSAACCGPTDAHRYTSDQVSLDDDGYHVPGYPVAIPVGRLKASQDQYFWAFFREVPVDSGEWILYCFFGPVTF